MDNFLEVLKLLFGKDNELRQIIGVTLEMSLASTLIASLLGMTFGVLLATREFRAKRLLLRISNTLMGLPPVVAGLIVFLLLSRSGPLGSLQLLYSVPAMVTAQVVLITPIVTSLSYTIISARWPQIYETAKGMGLPRKKQLLYTMYEVRGQLISVVLTGFGRAISEVGAVQIVGGNIQFKTRVMTTAIMMVTNMGQFQFAVALGAVLLLIAFIVNTIAQRLDGTFHKI